MSYILSYPDRVAELLRQHLLIGTAALVLSLLIAFPIGVFVARRRSLDVPVLGAAGIIYTIPSLALLAFLIQPLGLGARPVLVALVLYVQFVLIRNIVVGLRGVDPVVIEAARGMGMSQSQIFWQVELPLALPVILAGVRLAVVTILALTTIGAWVAAGGLGVLFNEGIAQDNPVKIQAGAIAIGALAIGLNQALVWFEHRASRWREAKTA